MKAASISVVVIVAACISGIVLVPIAAAAGGTVGFSAVGVLLALTIAQIWRRDSGSIQEATLLTGAAVISATIGVVLSFVVFCNVLKLECS